jgi:uncharacterized protein
MSSYKKIKNSIVDTRHINTILIPGGSRCKMKCRYCYAGFQSAEEPRAIDRGFLDACYDFLMKLRPFKRPSLVVGFGSDPLDVWDQFVYLSEKAKNEKPDKKPMVYICTTNGIGFKEEQVRYLVETDRPHISFSIDGTREVHLQNRPAAMDNINSYDEALKAFHLAKNHEMICSANMTFCHDNADLVQSFTSLHDIGFRPITMIPVRGVRGSAYTLTNETVEAYISQYREFIEYLKIQDDESLVSYLSSLSSADFFITYFAKICCGLKTTRQCGAGFTYAFVRRDGNIVPCSNFQNDQYVYSIGSLEKGIDYEKIEPITSFNCFKNSPCRDCWANNYCNGFCFYNAVTNGAAINEPFGMECIFSRKMVLMCTEFFRYLKDKRTSALFSYTRNFLGVLGNDNKYYHEA